MKRENLVAAGGPPRHVSSLDGIRALCCIGVIGHHFGFPMCQSGWVGVEMFFVLSGFLITTLLCREYRQTGRLSLPNFWARRAFRLLPIYWLYAAFLTVAVLCSGSRNFKPSGAWTLAMYVTSIWAYFVNFAPNGLWSHQLWTGTSVVAGERGAILFLLARVAGVVWAMDKLGVDRASRRGGGGNVGGIRGKMEHAGRLHAAGHHGRLCGRDDFQSAQESAAARIIATRTARWMIVMICLVLLLVLQLRTARLGDDVVREWGMHVNRAAVCVSVCPAGREHVVWRAGDSRPLPRMEAAGISRHDFVRHLSVSHGADFAGESRGDHARITHGHSSAFRIRVPRVFRARGWHRIGELFSDRAADAANWKEIPAARATRSDDRPVLGTRGKCIPQLPARTAGC